MTVRQTLRDLNPVATARHLDELGRTLFARGGSECITGDVDDPGSPCIRSVIQLDGDIITEARLVGTPAARLRLVEAHRVDLDDHFARMHRSIANARRGIVGTATAGVPAATALATTSMLPIYGLIGAAALSWIRRLALAIQALAIVALVALSVLSVRWWSLHDLQWMVWVWGFGLGLSAAAVGVGVVARRYVRRRLGAR